MTDWNKPQPAPKALWDIVHANFPRARNLGIFNKRNVAGTNKASSHSEGRALDIGLLAASPEERGLGDQLFRIFIANVAELGMSNVIWNRHIWSTTLPTVRHYTGKNKHVDHVHIEFTRAGSQWTDFPRTRLAISTLRTGIEDLSQAIANLA